MRALLGAIGFILLLLQSAAADEILHARAFSVCDGESPPFSDDDCKATSIDDLDPQGRELWIRASIDVPPAFIDTDPVGLFIAAKASSEVYLNGVRLGANGVPAPSNEQETPGRMDAVFAVPHGVLHGGENKIAIRMSSHHGVLNLRRPVHWVALAPYADPTGEWLKIMWPSLITFGVFLSGALYFAVVAATGVNRRDSLLLSLLSMFAAGQLLVEVVRSVYPYPYPVHDLRLIGIVIMSTGFALTLSGLIISRFIEAAKLTVFAAVAAMIVLTIIFAPGFDGKAGYAVFVAALATAAISARAAIRGDKQGVVYAAALTVFAASILLFRGAFLNTVFFFEVAALMLVLFAAQAVAYERERREREIESARAHELEAALQRAAESAEPAIVRVNGAGSVNVVPASNITHCKGAGDYVELHLSDGRQILHNGALAQLEIELPPVFLRVHRSFIVNTNFVKTLTRERSGIGALLLSNGAEVPVSRRIMPKVREALV